MADTAVTLSRARISPLSNPERHNGFNYKAKIKYTDVNFGSGATDTVTVTLGTTPAKWVVTQAAVNVTTAFAGTTAFTLTVGTASSAAAFVASTSVMTAGLIGAAGLVTASAAASTATTAGTIKAVFTNATGGSPSALTAGELDIYLSLIDTAKLP